MVVRFRQQLNENSKMLGWHNVIPEMNHNELLGWRTNVENFSGNLSSNKSDFERNQIRMDINKKSFQNLQIILLKSGARENHL